jgi:O-antigen/teichoic acid export membrane protein
LFAEPLVQLLFGDQYMVAVGILQILSLTLPFFAFSIFQENLLLAAPRVRVLLWSRVTSSTIHMLLAALLIPHYGASGAAIGCLAGQVIFSVTTAICWRRNYRLMPIDKSFLAPFAATGAAVAVFMLLAANSPWLGAGLGALVYLTLVLVWKGIRPAEFITLISYLRETSLRGRKPL